MKPEPFDVRQLVLFRGISDTDAARVTTMLQRVVFDTGARVLQKGLRGQNVYFLMRGSVKVCVVEYDREGEERTVMLSMLGAGEVLGEVSAVDGYGHSADVIALEHCVFQTMSNADFCSCLDTMPRISRNLTTLMTKRLRATTTHLHSLATHDVRGRVARQLASFGRRYSRPHQEEEIVIQMRLTQTDLAELVGASRVRVNEVMVNLKKEGIISVNSNCNVTIHKMPALLARCGDGPTREEVEAENVADLPLDAPPRKNTKDGESGFALH